MISLLLLMLAIILIALLLDLPATFYTTDRDILINRLQHWFGISSSALNLLFSFLSDGFQTAIVSNSKSQPRLLENSVLQGSVLGLLLYSLFTTPLFLVIFKYPGIRRFYARDTQIYLSFSLELTFIFSVTESCIIYILLDGF